MVDDDIPGGGAELLEELREPDIEPFVADALEVEGRRDQQALRPGIERDARLLHRLMHRGRGDPGIDLRRRVDAGPDERAEHRRAGRGAERRPFTRGAEQRDAVAAMAKHMLGMVDEPRQVDSAAFPHRRGDGAGEAEAGLIGGHFEELSDLNVD